MTLTQLTVVIIAMLLGAVVKGAIGTGLPMVAVPVMAGFLGAETAVVVMAVPTVVTNSILLWQHRDFARHTRHLPTLIACGVLGVAVGVWALSVVHAGVLLLVLAAVTAAYVLLFVVTPSLRLTPAAGRWLSPPVGTVSGALQGATGVSGPVIATYAHAMRLPRRAFLFQLVAQIQVFALVQVIGFTAVGLYSTDRLTSSLLAIAPAMAGLPVGMWLSSRLPRRTFELVVLAFLAVMAVKLIFDGVGHF